MRGIVEPLGTSVAMLPELAVSELRAPLPNLMVAVEISSSAVMRTESCPAPVVTWASVTPSPKVMLS
jgi:hypothetical protein